MHVCRLLILTSDHQHLHNHPSGNFVYTSHQQALFAAVKAHTRIRRYLGSNFLAASMLS